MDRKVDTRGDLVVGHGAADVEWGRREVEPYLSTGLGRRWIEAYRSKSKH